MLRIISEGTKDIGEGIRICFIDRHKAFDSAKWTKLMEILNKAGTDWLEKRLISKLYIDQSVKVRLDQGATECQDWKRS
jgi:hypothetical protein